MIKSLQFLFTFFVTTGTLVAQNVYSLVDLPESVKKDAHEIVLSDRQHFEIIDIENSRFSHSYVAMIMNRFGTDRKNIYLFYDNFTSIEKAEVQVLDFSGKVLSKYSLKDFSDVSTKDFSVAADNRAKILEINESVYPFIVSVSYEEKNKGSLFYPSWMPQTDENQSIVEAELTITAPEEINYRYQLNNLPDPVTTTRDGKTIRKWTVRNLPAFIGEPFNSKIEDYAPVVRFGPEIFKMDGFKGSMTSWKNFGDWNLLLQSGKNTLTDEQLSEIRELVAPLTDKKEKVKKVYEYMQGRTRYVSIQLGIGGWQPFESGFVHEKRYGDCKALTFYTKSLLEGVGIKSHYTIIRAGESGSELKQDFPISAFNHVILTVPLEKDTVWLECTSQTNPFGYLGTFTSDRTALLIDEGGNSKLIRTRRYTESENLQSTSANMTVDTDGTANVKLVRSFYGIENENKNFDYYARQPQKDKEDWFLDNHKWGTLKLEQLELQIPQGEIIPVGQLKADFQILSAARLSGKRYFFKPFVFTHLNNIDLPEKERHVPVRIQYGYSQSDTIKVAFPEITFPEKSLEDVIIKSKFGRYERKIVVNQYDYTFIREFTLYKGEYNPQEYSEFRDFIKSIQKADKESLVLVNKT